MLVPLILTLLAGAATFIGAFLGVLGQNRLTACWLFAGLRRGDHAAHLADGDAARRA